MNFISFQLLFYIYIGIAVFFILAAVFLFFYRLEKNKKSLKSALGFVLFEITLPLEAEPKKEAPSFRELVSIMEEFYVGMSAIF